MPEQDPQLDRDVVVDYEKCLTTARQFVQHYKAAQHMEQLVLLLTKREQMLQGLDLHRLGLEQQVADVQARIDALQKTYEDERARGLRELEALEVRKQEAHGVLDDLQKQTLEAMDMVRVLEEKQQSAADDLRMLEEKQKQTEEELAAYVVRVMDDVEQRSAALSRQRQGELAALERDYLVRLEAFQANAQAEAERAAQLLKTVARGSGGN